MNIALIVMLLSMPTQNWGVEGPRVAIPGFHTMEACANAEREVQKVWPDAEARCIELRSE